MGPDSNRIHVPGLRHVNVLFRIACMQSRNLTQVFRGLPGSSGQAADSPCSAASRFAGLRQVAHLQARRVTATHFRFGVWVLFYFFFFFWGGGG